jgi:hypothetical protein
VVPRYLRANTPPRIAKFRRSCGRHETVAPASSNKTGALKGSTVAIAGLRQPAIRPISSSAAATVAPVFPAEKNASASPARTILAATATLESGCVRKAFAGSSFIPMTPRARRNETLAGASVTLCSMVAASPTRINSSFANSLAAAKEPAMICPGALSPPRASTATRIRSALRQRVVTSLLGSPYGDYGTAFVVATLWAYPV